MLAGFSLGNVNASRLMHASSTFPPQLSHCFLSPTGLIVLYSLQDNHVIILLNLTCNIVHKSSILETTHTFLGAILNLS